MTIVGAAAAGAVVIGTLIYAGYVLGGRHVRHYTSKRAWRRRAALGGLIGAGACSVVMMLALSIPHHMAQTLLGAIPVATYFMGAAAGGFDGNKRGEVRGYDEGFLDALEHGRPGVER